MNRMPLLDWGSHELWLYIFENGLYINNAYRMGLPRVGCAMCPESSEKYVWLVDAIYPGLVDSYTDIICRTGTKTFCSDADKKEYIAKQGWQARKSGIVLNNTISAPIESTDGFKTVFRSAFFDEERFYTWLKPLGDVVIDAENGGSRLKLPRKLDEGIPFRYHTPYSGGGEFEIEFRSDDERLTLMPALRTMLKKSFCLRCMSSM